jgi:hypothetical protein
VDRRISSQEAQNVAWRRATSTSDDSHTTKRRAALEERLRQMRDLYELGDLHRAEYVARREAINAELSALTPAPIPDLDQARQVLEDFTIFWTNEADPTAKRQFLSLIFENVWLDQDRVVAVQPKPPFLPFFQRDRRPTTGETAGGKVRERRGPTLVRHPIEIRTRSEAVDHPSIGRFSNRV